MSETEDEPEATVEESVNDHGEEATRRQPDRPAHAVDPEVSAESFVSLEAELRGSTRSGLPAYARIVDARTVDPTDVPSDYPWTITTETALAVDLALDAESAAMTTVFFEWPPTATTRLGRMLAAAGIEGDSFADLNGLSVLVTEREGTVVPVIPPTGPEGSTAGFPALLLGQACNVALLSAVALGVNPLGAGVLVVLALLNLLVIPLATYLDARTLLTQTSWDQGPAFWGVLSMIPLGNLVVSALYLSTRRAAEPLVRG